MTLMPVPMVSNDQKVMFQLIAIVINLKNAMIPILVLLASCDTNHSDNVAPHFDYP